MIRRCRAPRRPWAAMLAAAVFASAAQAQPLDLARALEAVPESRSDEILSSEYQETAIRARAFECRAQDRAAERERDGLAGCGYWHLLTPGQQTRLQVMRRFFDVVEADVAAARDEEAMAVAYVQLDRARNRQELGQRSELEVAELDARYQRVRRSRYASVAAQRATRSLLANSLGRPDDLPSDVVPPSLSPPFPELDDVDVLLKEAEKGNAVLAQWRRNAVSDPTLQPLADQLETDLREAVLELWLEYSVLRVDLDSASASQLLRDLTLDRSRALYELEAKADLGDAMAQQTAARLGRMKTEYRMMMVLATLDALRGRSAPDSFGGGA